MLARLGRRSCCRWCGTFCEVGMVSTRQVGRSAEQSKASELVARNTTVNGQNSPRNLLILELKTCLPYALDRPRPSPQASSRCKCHGIVQLHASTAPRGTTPLQTASSRGATTGRRPGSCMLTACRREPRSRRNERPPWNIVSAASADARGRMIPGSGSGPRHALPIPQHPLPDRFEVPCQVTLPVDATCRAVPCRS